MSADQTASQEQNRLAAVLLLLVLLLLLSVFVSRFVLVSLLWARIGPAWIAASAEAIAIIGVSVLMRGALRGDPRSGSLASDFLIGYPLFGTLCFLVSLLSTTPTVLITAIAFAIGAVWIWSQRSRWKMRWPSEISVLAVLAGGCLVVALAMSVLIAQLPPTSLDELAYHLTIPKQWVQEGRAVDFPLLSHSYFPLGIESADIPLFVLLGNRGAHASHFLHLFAACASGIVIYRCSRRRVGAGHSLLFTAAVIATPALLTTAGWSWVDWPLLGITVLFFDELAMHWQKPVELSAEDTSSQAGLALAMAAGLLTKYTFLPLAFCLLAAAVVNKGGKRLVKPIVIGLTGGSVFFIRNLVLTGNPLSPFFEATAPSLSGYRAMGGIAERFSNYIFDGQFIDESLGVALPFLALAAVVRWSSRVNGFERAATFLLLLASILLFALAPSSRILLPFLLLLALGGVDLFRMSPLKSVHNLLIALLLTAVVLQLFLAAHLTARASPFSTLSGVLSDEAYSATMRKTGLTLRAAGERLSKGSRTLIIGINEIYWFPHRARGGGNFDGPRVSAYLEASDAGTLKRRLLADGFTHLLLAPSGIELDRGAPIHSKRAERLTALSPLAAQRLRELFEEEGAERVDDQGAVLVSLKP